MKLKIFSLAFLLIISTVTKAEKQWSGLPLPEFKLADQNGQMRNNSEFLGQWLVLYFYPKDKTPGCTVEAQNFSDDYQKYQLLNTNIIGVSFDDVASHKDFSDTYQMPFVLLSDIDKKLSKSLDIDRLFPWPHASRQTFIINPKGLIVKHYSDVSPKNHSKTLLEDLAKLQKL